MTTTVHPIELVEEPTPTAADYARRIQRKQLRVKALENRRETIVRELAESRAAQVQALAAGSGAPKRAPKELVELREDQDAIDGALEHLAREITELETQRAEAAQQEARDAERARIADAIIVAGELDACVRRLLDPASGELGLTMAKLNEAMQAVHRAQDAYERELQRDSQHAIMRGDQSAAVWKHHGALGPLLTAFRTFLEPPRGGFAPPPAA